MCQPKPGPRCSGYAQNRLDRARTAAAEATEAAEQAARARDGLRNRYREDPASVAASEMVAAEDAVLAAEALRDETETDRQRALQEFLTTPAGMEMLVEAAERESGGGDPDTATALYRRLNEARADRERQVSDLRAAEAMKDRLAHVTGQENAALMNARFPVLDAQSRLQVAESEYAAATAAEDQAKPEMDRLLVRHAAAAAAAGRARDAAETARAAVAEQAARLYQDAGCSPLAAQGLAEDMLRDAPMAGEIVMPDPQGRDAESQKAAVEAAQRDPAYQAALRQAGTAAAEHAERAQQAATIRREELDPQMERSASATRRALQAKYAVEDARADLGRHQDAANRLTARIGSGAGLDASAVAWEDAARQIRRNPDGSLNAYVYAQPSEGFPHGRYKRAVGIQQDPDGSALVLEDGSVARKTTGWRRSGPDAVSAPDKTVLLSVPHAGAVPVNGEMAFPSFASARDSSD